MLRILAFFFVSLTGGSAVAQIAFTNRTDLLTPSLHYSGVAIAVLDMNGDGKDDIVRLEQGTYLSIARQTGPLEPFSTLNVQSIANGSQWGMCAGDVDNNNFPDVLAGGSYDNIKLAMANDDGTLYSVLQFNQPPTFVQCMNLVDINNDGWLDAFICHDDGMSRVFGNDGTGQLVYQPGWMDLATVPASDNSGNYGSVWSDVDNDGDLDLYIAKCRQGVSNPADGRRINQLFLNNGDGTYTQDTANVSGLRIGAQSWTADFGDIDNDGDFDCFITNHDVKSQLLENDGSGHFTDISPTSGVEAIGGLPIQGVFRDFDNDGYLDIIVAGSLQYLLRNNGDKTFTKVNGLFDSNNMESYGIGDLNHDGFLDIYAGYANIYTSPSNKPDVLWMNNGNGNNYFGLNLTGVQSNRDGVGAKVLLYSALGVQVREVRAGESYGIMNSTQIHFGMDSLTVIDSVIVRWPSGIVDKIELPDVNQYINLQEGGCTLPVIEIQALGATVFCPGDSVALQAPAGYDYLWSTGDSTQTIQVFAEGSYQVTVTAQAGCSAVSGIVQTTVDPIEMPAIQIDGDTVFCAGGSVVLHATPSSAYLWSTGDTIASITVTENGVYTVSTQGLCSMFASDPVSVHVLAAALPLVTADTIPVATSALLRASGDSLAWYDAPVAGSLLATGDTFLTLPLDSSATFWVGNFQTFDQPNVFTGQKDHQGTNVAGNQFNGDLIFDCFSPVTLARVKVYTSVAGARKIDLRDAGGATVQSKVVDIPVGTTVIDLGFDLQPGIDFKLTTDQAVNQSNFSTISPQLRRSDQGVVFPYEVPGVLSIKSTSLGSDRYYYFYDWELDFEAITCASDRVPVTAVVDTTLVGVSTPGFALPVAVFPNPGSGVFTADFPQWPGGAAWFTVRNAQGKLVRSQALDLPAGRSSQQIDLLQLPKGLYRLEWRTERGSVVRNVVIQ